MISLELCVCFGKRILICLNISCWTIKLDFSFLTRYNSVFFTGKQNKPLVCFFRVMMMILEFFKWKWLDFFFLLHSNYLFFWLTSFVMMISILWKLLLLLFLKCFSHPKKSIFLVCFFGHSSLVACVVTTWFIIIIIIQM